MHLEETVLEENSRKVKVNYTDNRENRKTETKAKIEVWASGDKENLELKFESEKKRRKANFEKKQIKEVPQEKRALTDISKWVNMTQDNQSFSLPANHLVDSWLESRQNKKSLIRPISESLINLLIQVPI
ncbi:2779_t:CDS:2 [Gigaspora rosea]|nr:2779_t:CDS:2 [Gigaspora rosea]